MAQDKAAEEKRLSEEAAATKSAAFTPRVAGLGEATPRRLGGFAMASTMGNATPRRRAGI